MKQIILALSILTLFSCTKQWDCTIESTTTGMPADSPLEELNGTTTMETEFFGTKEEKEYQEEAGTTESDHSIFYDGNIYTYTISQTTECN